MDLSIKRKDAIDGITADKDYLALAVTSGGLIILNDDRNFKVIGFDRIGNEWELTTSEDAKAKTSKPTTPEKVDPTA